DGFFVRSPVKYNGAVIPDGERRKFEDQFLARQKRREGRESSAAADTGSGDGAPTDVADVGGLIQQSRQPQFVSSAYFLRFKFEEGKYALVGRETLDGLDVLRVEYYPREMFTPDNRRRRNSDNEESAKARTRNLEMQRLMNKVALITL